MAESNPVDSVISSNSMLRCTLCKNWFNDPRMLPCAHSFCHECLLGCASSQKNQTLPCPTCRQKTTLPKGGVKGFPLNISFINLLERKEFFEKLSIAAGRAQTCNFCQKDETVAFCLECSIAICRTCQRGHSRLPGMKVHSVLDIGKVTDPAYMSKVAIVKAPYCTKHEREKFRYYCTVCEMLVCRDCTVLDHRDHECVEARKQSPQEREGLKYLVDLGGKQMQECVAHIETGKQGTIRLKREAHEQCRKVEDTFEKIVGILRNNKDALCTQLMTIRDQKLDHLRKELGRSSQWIEYMRNARSVTSKMVEVNNPWEILALVTSLRKAFDGLRVRAERRKKFERSELELGASFACAYSSEDLSVLRVGDIVEESLVLFNYDPVRNKVERHVVPQ